MESKRTRCAKETFWIELSMWTISMMKLRLNELPFRTLKGRNFSKSVTKTLIWYLKWRFKRSPTDSPEQWIHFRILRSNVIQVKH